MPQLDATWCPVPPSWSISYSPASLSSSTERLRHWPSSKYQQFNQMMIKRQSQLLQRLWVVHERQLRKVRELDPASTMPLEDKPSSVTDHSRHWLNTLYNASGDGAHRCESHGRCGTERKHRSKLNLKQNVSDRLPSLTVARTSNTSVIDRSKNLKHISHRLITFFIDWTHMSLTIAN